MAQTSPPARKTVPSRKTSSAKKKTSPVCKLSIRLKKHCVFKGKNESSLNLCSICMKSHIHTKCIEYFCQINDRELLIDESNTVVPVCGLKCYNMMKSKMKKCTQAQSQQEKMLKI